MHISHVLAHGPGPHLGEAFTSASAGSDGAVIVQLLGAVAVLLVGGIALVRRFAVPTEVAAPASPAGVAMRARRRPRARPLVALAVALSLTAVNPTAPAVGQGGGDGELPAEAPSPGFLVNPFLQHPGPDRMTVVFELAAPAGLTLPLVEYRPVGSALPFASAVAPLQLPPVPSDQAWEFPEPRAHLDVHAAQLTGLTSDTTYEYRVVTAGGTSALARFRTWPVEADGVDQGRFIVMSDIQGQNLQTWFTDVLGDIIDRECGGVPEACADTIDGIIVPGDLTDSSTLQEWREEWFALGDPLFRNVPQIQAPGNHDLPLWYYLAYFDPPSNGSAAFDEEWYALDFLGIRILSMQSNLGGPQLPQRVLEQRAWLRLQLQDPGPRYVFMNIHAPCRSELWIPGESTEVCEYVDALEQHSADTGAITGHFYGHTHAYSRGQSRDVPHLWVNAASAGGAIDDWGDYAMRDYPEMATSWDEYGYVLAEFATTGTPSVRIIRRSGGDDHQTYADAFGARRIRDDLVVGGDNQPPAAPSPVAPDPVVRTTDVILEVDVTDADDDELVEGHWQVVEQGGSFEDPHLDIWGTETRTRNDWFRTDLNALVDVTAHRVDHLPPGGWCWRMRARDAHLAWSPWSVPACFEVAGVEEGPDLVANGGAEEGVTGWATDEGRLASVAPADCPPEFDMLSLLEPSPLLPMEGARLFSLGGCSASYGATGGEGAPDTTVASQVLDVSASAAAIDAGRVTGVLQAAVRTGTRWDPAHVRFTAQDGDGRALFTSRPLANQFETWRDGATSLVLPPGTRQVRILLTGQVQQGPSADAFVDDVRFHLVTSPERRSPFDACRLRFSPGDGMALRGRSDVPFPAGPHVAPPPNLPASACGAVPATPDGSGDGPGGGAGPGAAPGDSGGAGVPVPGAVTGSDDPPAGPAVVAVAPPGTDATAASIAWSVQRFGDGEAVEALYASDEVFADALASGPLQRTRPLLLGSPARLEPELLAELRRLGTARVRVLGGPDAVGQSVVDELDDAGIDVIRTAGETRLETARLITDIVSGSRQQLARASAPADAHGSTPFADSLALGAWAAVDGSGVLLTQTDVLSAATAAAWRERRPDLLTIVGGTAAVVPEIEEELAEMGITTARVAGPDRAQTAVEVARARGVSSELPARSVVLLEGYTAEAWQAGFTAAGPSAAMGAPVLLADGEELPAATAAFLAEAIESVDGATAVWCAASATACDAAAEIIGSAR